MSTTLLLSIINLRVSRQAQLTHASRMAALAMLALVCLPCAAAMGQQQQAQQPSGGTQDERPLSDQERRETEAKAYETLTKYGVLPLRKNIGSLYAWAYEVKGKIGRGELDPSSALEFTAEMDLDDPLPLKDGQYKLFVLKNVEVKQKAGDPRYYSVAKDLLREAARIPAGDYLEGVRHVSLFATATPASFELRATLTAETDERASHIAKGYTAMLEIAALWRRGKTDEEIYRSIKLSSEGKQVKVVFGMSRENLLRIINNPSSAP